MTTRTGEHPATEPATYGFGTGTAAGVWLGISTAGAVLLGAGLLAGILAVTAGVPVWFAILPFVIAGTLALLRTGGRPLVDWAAPAGQFHAATLTGSRGWSAGLPALLRGAEGRDGVRVRLPREFGRPRLLACPDDPDVGVLLDRSTGTVTVAFTVAGVDRFPLLDPAGRDQLLTSWGQALAVLADTDQTLSRLQLIERATTSLAPDPVAVTDRGGSPAAGTGDLAADYQALQRDAAGLATSHDSRLVVQWTPGKVDSDFLATLLGRCRAVSRSLLPAQLVTAPLSTAGFAYDLTVGLLGPLASAWGVGVPGAVSRRTGWSQVRIDGAVHRSWAIIGWPTSPVAADWLSPLLLTAPTGVTRTVAVHLERVEPAAAARIARTARAKAVLDQRDRVRLGMTSSAAIDQAETAGAAMDSELAAGFRTHRITALATLTATDDQALAEAGRTLLQAAAVARLDLRPLHGQQDRALAATLPLCRVRPRRHP